VSISAYASDLQHGLATAKPIVERLCAQIWDLAELSLHEAESVNVYRRELEAAGFTITSTGTAGVPTAFIAEWAQASDGPKVGFLLEYDALPELGNAAVPRKEPRADGTTSGHGCGHNLIGAGLAGAAIALKHTMEANGLPGTLRLYGCAAEETEGAKVYMAREGLFNDLDACFHWHPAPIAAVINVRMAAINFIKLEFFGKTAHAGIEPWKGRSALHAMELATHGLNLMREHLEPTARLHYVFEAGGIAPNVVTDYARMWIIVRDVDRARVVTTSEWVRQIAVGAALATQTESKANQYYGIHDLLPNTPLAERMQEHLQAIGAPAWTEAEQAFAMACQKEMGVPQHGLVQKVMPLYPEPTLGGSSDVAEASWLTPTMGVAMPTLPLHVSLHTWVVTACGGMSIGVRGTLAATEVIALTALDVMTNPELREAARDDFKRRTEGFTYVSPLPPEQRHPVTVPVWLISDGSVEAVANLEESVSVGAAS
jgi:aminobenzoyl-glutamate utilization protein B